MMKIPPWARLLLYLIVGVCPMWIDWAAKSWDLSARGLVMPILGTILTGCTIILARTTSIGPADEPPHEEPPANP